MIPGRIAFFGFCALIAAPAAAEGWVACANGLMCVRAPCPSTNLLDLGTGEVSFLHQFDDSALSPEDREALKSGEVLREGSRVVFGEVQRRRAVGGFSKEEATTLALSGLGRETTEAERQGCRAGGSPLNRPTPPGAPILE